MRKKLLGLFAALGMIFGGIGVSVAPTEAQAQSSRYDRGDYGVRGRDGIRGDRRARGYRNGRWAEGFRGDRRARAHRGARADRRFRGDRRYGRGPAARRFDDRRRYR